MVPRAWDEVTQPLSIICGSKTHGFEKGGMMDDVIVLVYLMRGFLSINTDMQFKRKLMRESSVMGTDQVHRRCLE